MTGSNTPPLPSIIWSGSATSDDSNHNTINSVTDNTSGIDILPPTEPTQNLEQLTRSKTLVSYDYLGQRQRMHSTTKSKDTDADCICTHDHKPDLLAFNCHCCKKDSAPVSMDIHDHSLSKDYTDRPIEDSSNALFCSEYSSGSSSSSCTNHSAAAPDYDNRDCCVSGGNGESGNEEVSVGGPRPGRFWATPIAASDVDDTSDQHPNLSSSSLSSSSSSSSSSSALPSPVISSSKRGSRGKRSNVDSVHNVDSDSDSSTENRRSNRGEASGRSIDNNKDANSFQQKQQQNYYRYYQQNDLYPHSQQQQHQQQQGQLVVRASLQRQAKWDPLALATSGAHLFSSGVPGIMGREQQSRLLFVSLLENYCRTYCSDPLNNRRLFFAICNTLSSMGIIGKEYVDEVSSIRATYSEALRQLVVRAQQSLDEYNEFDIETGIRSLTTGVSADTETSYSLSSGYANDSSPRPRATTDWLSRPDKSVSGLSTLPRKPLKSVVSPGSSLARDLPAQRRIVKSPMLATSGTALYPLDNVKSRERACSTSNLNIIENDEAHLRELAQSRRRSRVSSLSTGNAFETMVMDMQRSRYFDDFVQLRCLGKGGFGKVFEVQNKLDGRRYAVKHIKIKGEITAEKTLREIKTLANLEHANIVRYYSSWIEVTRVRQRHIRQHNRSRNNRHGRRSHKEGKASSYGHMITSTSASPLFALYGIHIPGSLDDRSGSFGFDADGVTVEHIASDNDDDSDDDSANVDSCNKCASAAHGARSDQRFISSGLSKTSYPLANGDLESLSSSYSGSLSDYTDDSSYYDSSGSGSGDVSPSLSRRYSNKKRKDSSIAYRKTGGMAPSSWSSIHKNPFDVSIDSGEFPGADSFDNGQEAVVLEVGCGYTDHHTLHNNDGNDDISINIESESYNRDGNEGDEAGDDGIVFEPEVSVTASPPLVRPHIRSESTTQASNMQLLSEIKPIPRVLSPITAKFAQQRHNDSSGFDFNNSDFSNSPFDTPTGMNSELDSSVSAIDATVNDVDISFSGDLQFHNSSSQDEHMIFPITDDELTAHPSKLPSHEWPTSPDSSVSGNMCMGGRDVSRSSSNSSSSGSNAASDTSSDEDTGSELGDDSVTSYPRIKVGFSNIPGVSEYCSGDSEVVVSGTQTRPIPISTHSTSGLSSRRINNDDDDSNDGDEKNLCSSIHSICVKDLPSHEMPFKDEEYSDDKASRNMLSVNNAFMIQPMSLPTQRDGLFGGDAQYALVAETTLFVQMQLCQTTLQEFLNQRNRRISERHEKEVSAQRLVSGSTNSGTNTRRASIRSADGKMVSRGWIGVNEHDPLIDPILNIRLFRSIVEGVKYFHDRGIIHRDLKGANVFLDIVFPDDMVGPFTAASSSPSVSSCGVDGPMGETMGVLGVNQQIETDKLTKNVNNSESQANNNNNNGGVNNDGDAGFLALDTRKVDWDMVFMSIQASQCEASMASAANTTPMCSPAISVNDSSTGNNQTEHARTNRVADGHGSSSGRGLKQKQKQKQIPPRLFTPKTEYHKDQPRTLYGSFEYDAQPQVSLIPRIGDFGLATKSTLGIQTNASDEYAFVSRDKTQGGGGGRGSGTQTSISSSVSSTNNTNGTDERENEKNNEGKDGGEKGDIKSKKCKKTKQRKQQSCGRQTDGGRTSNVGTITYAAPEQLKACGGDYNEKADIYSLGIIFFELYYPFSTAMERITVIKELRDGVLPPAFVHMWPKEAAFILWLMADDPQKRPSAKEILAFDLIDVPSLESAQLRKEVSKLKNQLRVANQRNEELMLRVAELERLVDMNV